MNIETTENKKKIIYDIFDIFYDKEDINFKENPDIIIKDKIYYKGYVKDYKDNHDLKVKLYHILEKETGYTSKWGILTGSKPQKLYRMKREKLKQEYLVDDSKIDLMKNIDNIQKNYHIDKDGFNLYINIPFCPSRCDYCSYPTIVYKKNDYRKEYLEYIIKELRTLPVNKFQTIYIGGGTPSSLCSKDLEILLKEIDKFDFDEFTFEAGREDTIDKEKLDILKNHNVTRISINPQTFNSKVIESLNRIQDNDRLIELYNYAKDKFIVNMDFIIGLRKDDFIENLKIIEELKPNNVTFHTLSIKSGSKFYESNDRFKEEKKNAEKILQISKERLKELSYNPYYLYRQKEILSNLENIGFELNNTASIYNIIINEEYANIIGVGMNANSKFTNNKKLRMDKNYRDYKKNIDQKIAKRNEILNKL